MYTRQFFRDADRAAFGLSLSVPAVYATETTIPGSLTNLFYEQLLARGVDKFFAPPIATLPSSLVAVGITVIAYEIQRSFNERVKDVQEIAPIRISLDQFFATR